mgnify:CR=1 FL=1
MQVTNEAPPYAGGFRPWQLALLLLLAVLGALAIGISLKVHPEIQSHVDVLNPRQPMNVLVGIQGSPDRPVFIGLVAVVQPTTRTLTVVPVSGSIPVVADHQTEPLYEAVSGLPAKAATRLVSQATQIPIDHYFYITPKDLMLVLDALYYHSPGWPKTETPVVMLNILGYPSGRVAPRQQVAFIDHLVSQLPTISPIAAGSLLQIPKSSVTNLTSYQLFLLANYVRGDQLVPGNPQAYHHSVRRTHG